jgi:hypothetical protein
MTASAQPAGTPAQILAARPPEQWFALAELAPDALPHLLIGAGVRGHVTALMSAGQFPDAVRLLAHALPRREGVWWAWWCARRSLGSEAPPPAVLAAIGATERWIAQPTDEHRRAAFAAAEAVGIGTPAGCAGAAAFFSAGSMGPPHVAEVPPPEFASAKAVAGGVTLSAVAGDPAQTPDRFRQYLEQGLEVGRRVGLWT